MIDHDHDADKFALVGGLAILPFAAGVLGSWLWPLFNSAGSSVHQDFRLSEILTGFVIGAVVGFAIGATLLYFRKVTEPAVEEPAVDPFEE